MRKLILILYLLFLSCDSSEIFGVHELDDTTLDYYDYLARGWQAVFDEDYDLAMSDFNEATLLDSVDNKNSAFVGLGWTSTFQANAFFNSSECILSTDIACVDVINNLRLNAKDYFDLATESCLDTSAVSLDNWDNTEAGCSTDGYIYSNVELAEAEYIADQDDYINTFEEFNKDLEIGKIYLELLEFDMSDFDLLDALDMLELEGIIEQFEQFLLNYPYYDIAANKPLYESTFDFDYQHIYVLLSQLLLRLGNDCKAEYYLITQNICPEIYLSSEACYNINNNTCICDDVDEQLIFQCIQLSTQ